MGIKSTRDITRQEAIDRILLIDRLALMKDYEELDQRTGEYDHNNIKDFIESYVGNHSEHELDQWTDRMLELKMDEPFFRESIFYNYMI